MLTETDEVPETKKGINDRAGKELSGWKVYPVKVVISLCNILRIVYLFGYNSNNFDSVF